LYKDNYSDVATVLENLALLLRKTNRKAEAKEMEGRARAIRGRGIEGVQTMFI
jgi:hypothetical protein